MCSVALAEDGAIVCSRESSEPRMQSSLTAVFVDEVLRERGLKVRDCDAVCVSRGPGSYTGLRVGVSTAKGLCFGAGIPLLSVGTLDTLAWQALTSGVVPEDCRTIVPMIDARRMEVYCARFAVEDGGPGGDGSTYAGLRPVMSGEVAPVIVDGDTFAEDLERGTVLFIGDAADKCAAVISHPNARFVQCCPTASAMLRPASDALETGRFEDTAYFEPFYLKDFIATVPRKKLF